MVSTLEHIREAIRKSVIYSDSLSCLQALQNKNMENPILQEIIHILSYLKEVGSQIPPWGPGGLSRECVLRIPMRVVKGD